LEPASLSELRALPLGRDGLGQALAHRNLGTFIMPRDGKHRFTEKQHRQAMHIKASMKAKGKSDEDAERIGWAALSKQKKRGLGAMRRK
jgi:hypothetical protein